MSSTRGKQSVEEYFDRIARMYYNRIRRKMAAKISTRNLKVSQNFTNNGTTTLNGESQFNEIVTVNDKFTTNAESEFNENITVNGKAEFNQNVGINSDLEVSQSLNVLGGIRSNGHLLVPPGTIMVFGGETAPGGYLICDGDAVSRATYHKLFAVISTIFGVGDGASTFNLPDLRNRKAIGSSVDHTLGAQGGSQEQTLTSSHIPPHNHSGTTEASGNHTHTVNDPGHAHNRLNAVDDNNGSNNPGQAPVGDANDNYTTGHPTQSATTNISINQAGSHTHTFTTSSVGEGASFSIMNPFLALNYIIKF